MRAISLLPALAAVLMAQRAEVPLDRVAVTVGNSAITETEILEEIRVTALLNAEQPEFTIKARREAAERLVDQYLIRRDMRAIRYPEPETSEAEKILADLKRTRFGGDDGYLAALRKYGVSEQDLKQHVLWQLAALRFTDYRFRAGTQPPGPGLQRRLENEAEERAEARTSTGPRTDNAAPEDSTDRQMDEWLKQTRARTRIRFHEEAFR